MRRAGTLCALLVPWIAAAQGLGQTAVVATSSAPEPETPRVVRLTVTPAAEPVPALKYALLPPAIDRKPGDAVTLYYVTADQLHQVLTDQGFQDNIVRWQDMPLNELPVEEVRRRSLDGMLGNLELAARRETCQWEYPIREQGIAVQLPSLAKLRQMARVLTVQARLEIRDGHPGAAIRDLQTGFAMARQVAQAPILIHELVGIGIAQMLCQPIEDLIAQPGSPNLYWAIGVLPRPFVDLWAAAEWEPTLWESTFLYYTVQDLQRAHEGKLAQSEWDPLLRQVTAMLARIDEGFSIESKSPSDPEMATRVTRAYAAAKPWWLAQGYTPEQIEAMPVGQVVLVHALHEYDRLMAESIKWFTVPYWQALPGMRQRSESLERQTKGPEASLMAMLVPSLEGARSLEASLEQRLAGLQVIEAIRMYAAAHDGRLPSSLDQITQVPVPLDPMVNKPFPYTCDGKTAVLDAFAPKELGWQQNDVRYEITMAKAATTQPAATQPR